MTNEDIHERFKRLVERRANVRNKSKVSWGFKSKRFTRI